MPFLNLITISLLFLANLPFMLSSPTMELHIRKATIEDVETITQIELHTNSQMPSFRYLYPDADKYPEDTYKRTLETSRKFIQNEMEGWDYLTLVAEAEIEGKEGMTIIAFTAYEISALGLKKRDETPLPEKQVVLKEDETNGKPERKENEPSAASPSTWRDLDPVRSKVYSKIINDARRTYLEPTGVENGPLSYVHMTRLNTHPDYQRHGAGTALSKYGLDLAQNHNVSVGLFASPMGLPLYEHLGFRHLADIKVQVEGEEESCTMVAMKWYPRT